MVPFTIAGVQMKVAMHKDNVSAMEQQLNLVKAKFPFVQMVVFSELCVNGPLIGYAKDYPHSDIATFQAMAKKHNVWLIPGSFFERRDTKIFNTSVVINPEGELIGRYDKMFPFLPFEANVEPGSNFMIFDVPDVGRFGLSICYDMWFPETTRTLVSEGVEVLIHPVLTGTNDRDVELAMGRATAAQFQCYIIDINGLRSGGIGRSQVISPSGDVIYQSGTQEDLLVVEVDLAQVRRQREAGLRGLGQPLKSFRDRNLDFPIYNRESDSGTYLKTLGPMTLPQQGNRAGIDAPAPSEAIKAYKASLVSELAGVVDSVVAPESTSELVLDSGEASSIATEAASIQSYETEASSEVSSDVSAQEAPIDQTIYVDDQATTVKS